MPGGPPGKIQRLDEPRIPFLQEPGNPPDPPEAAAEGEPARRVAALVRQLDRLTEIVTLLLEAIEPRHLLRSEKLGLDPFRQRAIELAVASHIGLPSAGTLKPFLPVRA